MVKKIQHGLTNKGLTPEGKWWVGSLRSREEPPDKKIQKAHNLEHAISSETLTFESLNHYTKGNMYIV